ncbi:acyltransferase family protein [Pseudenhygromyxa sp. WMMC2535]|uniref:lysophospholipid acyltransferase family protein n=1 Tax=Pseudenhygromyxa sp. WMMC2535 TaxID=2712867 RepID=UPI00155707ED|nr:lysophospholipid acyltransferase family protein [Pseudenhygromyxa sp. WMMC2535]NVB37905.1 acyltransferase family protein [Pseudenhygromyxa sp. WMMC2535]
MKLRPDLVFALLPEEERARVEAYVLDDAGLGTDVFGTTTEGMGMAYALAYWLHRYYFRVESAGHENVPATGAGVVVGNHSGVLPFDAIMISADVFRRLEPPRLVRFMVDFFVYRMPVIGTLFRSLGQIPGTRRNFDALMEHGHLVGIFPEGTDALGKPADERYQLYPFTHGHVELAARHGVPVIPFGVVGAEEQQTVITNLRPLAQALGLPYIPVTRTFPLFGPLGLLPKPVRYYIHYGEALTIDPAVLESIEVRSREVERVRSAVAEQIRLGREVRERSEGER